jgi:membrane AbrB-like protein
MNILLLILLHIVALFGGFLFIRLKAPAGALVGSMAAVVIFLVVTKTEVNYYPFLRFMAQVLSGLIIGLGFSRSNIAMLKKMVKPVLVFLGAIFIINLLFSFVMFEGTKLDYMTSLFASGLGGVADLALIATDFNANMEIVALLQLFRLVSVVIIFPPLIKFIFRKHEIVVATPTKVVTKVKEPVALRFIITLIVAFSGGLIFNLLKIPAGPILGSIFATALLNILTAKGGAPAVIRPLAQIFVGAYIGSNLTIATLLEIKILFVPYLILVLEIFTMAFFGAFLFNKIFKIDWKTALFCSAPGGVHVMGLIGQEFGIDGPTVVLMHTMRIFGTLMILPLIAGLFG